MTIEELEILVKQLRIEVNTLKDSVATLSTQVSKEFLQKLQDVKIDDQSAPLTFGDVLQYGNDGKWHNIQPTKLGISNNGSNSSATRLSELLDVNIVGQYNGQVLTYSSAYNAWVNKEPSKSDSDLSDYLTKQEAENTYFKLNGGTINGDVTINGTLLTKKMITGESNVLVYVFPGEKCHCFTICIVKLNILTSICLVTFQML